MRNVNLNTGRLLKSSIGAFFAIFITITTAFGSQNQQIQQKLVDLAKIQGKFSFVVMGDNRSGDDIYRKLVSMEMERKPDFVINTGDMIAKPGNKEEWSNFWEMSKPITVAYFLTVGNHDIHPKVKLSEKIYRDEVDLPGNELYYSFVAGNSLFLVLDTDFHDQTKKIAGEQFKWLKRVLANSKQKHKFVFLHAPLYTVPGKGRHAGESLDKKPSYRNLLEALFVKNKVEAVFAGHEHFYQRTTHDKIAHIITGGGGAPLYAEDKDGGFNHFIFVTVDGDQVNAEVVDINGNVRDKF